MDTSLQETNAKPKNWFRRHPVWTLVIGIFLLGGISSALGGGKNATSQTASQSSVVSTTAAPDTRTPEQKLEDALKTKANRSLVGTSFQFQSLVMANKALTIKIAVNSFFDKIGIMHGTGQMSSQIFQAVYSSGVPVPDAVIWYNLKANDKYGNPTEETVLTYSIDQATFSKINWQNFEQDDFCGFLSNEATDGADCHILANFK